MTWEQRFGALVALDGDEWDAAHERLEQEWLGAYTAAFVEIAVSRGWRRVDAGATKAAARGAIARKSVLRVSMHLVPSEVMRWDCSKRSGRRPGWKPEPRHLCAMVGSTSSVDPKG